ncbi:MAG TPA: hypothetical protein PLX35_14915 [Cyclobacteriaceae bacterium]|nr:hypothetical protein [Cyclobacteriaceae bacterium]
MANQKESIEDSLQSASEGTYGKNYKDHLLEQYKLYIEMTDKISDRRQTVNNFFLTITTAFISAIGITGFFQQEKTEINKDFILFLTIGVVVSCYVWYRMIRSYKDLNSAKFKVIHEIEKQLPIRPFEAEWTALGRGKNKRKYLPFSRIEMFIPLILGLINLSLMLYLWFFYG